LWQKVGLEGIGSNSARPYVSRWRATGRDWWNGDHYSSFFSSRTRGPDDEQKHKTLCAGAPAMSVPQSDPDTRSGRGRRETQRRRAIADPRSETIHRERRESHDEENNCQQARRSGRPRPERPGTSYRPSRSRRRWSSSRPNNQNSSGVSTQTAAQASADIREF
jgi:hypothetical protein